MFFLRYDVRNRLEDKNQFGLKPNIPHKMPIEEEQLEDMLDKERYLSLDCDILEQELREGAHNGVIRWGWLERALINAGH